MTVANVIDKTQVITKLWFQGCRPNPAVLLTGLNLAGMRAFSTLLQPNWKTLVKKTTGHSWLCGMKAVLLGADESDALYTAASEAVFTSLEWIDAAAFYFWIAGVGIDFLIDWTSLVYEFSGCKNPEGWAMNTSGTGFVSAPLTFTKFTNFETGQGRTEWTTSSGFLLPPNSHYSVSLNTNTSEFLGLPNVDYDWQWRDGAGNVLMTGLGQPNTSVPGGGGAVVFEHFENQTGSPMVVDLYWRLKAPGFSHLDLCQAYVENQNFNDYSPYPVKPSNC